MSFHDGVGGSVCVVGNIGGAFLKGIVEGSVGGGICVAVNIGGAFLNGICGAGSAVLGADRVGVGTGWLTGALNTW